MNGSFTLETWLKFDPGNSGKKPIDLEGLRFFEYGSVRVIFQDKDVTDDGQLVGLLIVGPELIQFRNPTTLDDFIWTHFTISISGTIVRLITHSHLPDNNSTSFPREVNGTLSQPVLNQPCVIKAKNGVRGHITGLGFWKTFDKERMINNRNTSFSTGKDLLI